VTAGAGQSRYVRSDRILWRRTMDGVVVLPVEHGEYFDLTGTGLVLWELLGTPHTVDEAAAALLARYEGSPGQVAADLAPVLEDLVRRQAVVVLEEPVGPGR
jgi:hypothetical protein